MSKRFHDFFAPGIVILFSVFVLGVGDHAFAICPAVNLKCYKIKDRKVFYGNYSEDVRQPKSEAVIDGADAETFREITWPGFGKEWNPCTSNCAFYGKDKNYVYFEGTRMIDPKPDPGTFRALENGEYFVDKNWVYDGSRVLKGFNPAKFHFENGYWQDSQTIRVRSRFGPINISKKSFKSFGDGNYLGDANHVYSIRCGDAVIDSADVNSFRVLQDRQGKFSYYAIDKNYAYYCGAKLNFNPDLATLHVEISDMKACDKTGCYSGQQRMNSKGQVQH